MDSIINCVVSMLQGPVTKAMGYVLKVGANVRALNKALDQLQLKKEEVNGKIQAATVATDEEKPTKRVEKWLEEVDAIELEVAEIETDYGQRTTRIGGCLLNFWSGYWIGRRAFNKTVEVKEVDGRGDFDVVTERTIPVVQWRPNMPDAPALEPHLEKVRSYLGDNMVVRVGIWGMGGVGKTFLLQKIHSDPCVAGAGFDYVIWAVVSQKPDFQKLQGDIAERLQLPLPEGDAVSRGEKIQRFLEKKKFLLLLDDLWSPLDLHILGVPHPRQGDSGGVNPKQQVVFTTRTERVCMIMKATMNIRLECLEWKAAWHLFKENIGELVATIINSDEMVRNCAVRVAKKCGGLPLALKVIGQAMSFKKTLSEWQDAINMLDRLQLPEMWSKSDDPFPLLKFSYDYLSDDRTRECFLCCSLWPEDAEITKDELILCWMGHGLLDDLGDFRHAYNKGRTVIEDLKQACLLEQYVDYCEVIFFKMHDVIRGLALWIASECGANEKKWIVEAGVGLEEAPDKWREAEKISFMSNRIETLPQQPHCPNLTTLVLQENQNLCFPDAFFNNMPALTYLDIADVPMHVLPTEFDRLISLRYLDLSKTQIESLPEGLGSLAGLEYLLLRNTMGARWIH